MKKITLLLLTIGVIAACNKEAKIPQSEKDETIIIDYIADNELKAEASGTGLYYVIDEQGTGDFPTPISTVRVSYRGYLTDGNVFDQSSSQGIIFSLSEVIKGWTEGIPKFKEGGKGMLLIPSALGYGSQGSGEIPRNAVIIFDIELLEVF